MKLLVTGAWNCSETQLDEIRRLGHEIVFMQQEKDDLPCDYGSVEGVICNGLFLYHDIAKFTSLRFIQLTSAGYDRVPMEYVLSHGIKIYNARGVYSKPMAEFALSGVLQLYKQSKFFNENQKRRKWEKKRDLLELSGKTVLIVGCGSVGTECAKRFKAFDCNVIGVDIKPYLSEVFEKISDLSDLDNQLSDADVVVLTLPLTNETKHLFNANRFERMKTGAVLVNIARGAVVDEKALLTSLDNKLLGAVIDVFEEEPLDTDSELWGKENVILTPHNSFVGDGNNKRLFNVIVNDLGEHNG
ncbi:MAG: hydroxyacid dehydrogenase [Clostridia bacterium]|nr:hydroxyacid dehydrogenase [Clostridia bacterium]